MKKHKSQRKKGRRKPLLIARRGRAARRTPRIALLVGGAGRMGRLFARFFRRKGFAVRIVDPAGTLRGFAKGSLDEAAKADVILVAASLEHTATALAAVLDRNPKGLVFDIASVKTPLLPLFARACERGVAIASAHPMFGPDARLSGRDFLVLDAGDEAAAKRVVRLFAGQGLKIGTMPAKEHDRWVGRTMGFAHVVALVSALSLTELGVSRKDVDGRATTTFRHLLALVGSILEQDPALTRAIQAQNPESPSVIEHFTGQVEALRHLLFEGDGSHLKVRLAAVRAALR